MHYFSYNISDYMSHTGHLSLLEDLAYRRCLDIYYLHEKPLPEDASQVARLIRMPDNVPEVRQVLTEFFVLDTGTGWTNQRGNEEIDKYHAKIQAASKAGKASAEQRRFLATLSKSNARSTKVQPTNNHKPITKKQETINKTLKRPDTVDKKTWEDFLKHRKNLNVPLTETALKGITSEAAKASITLEEALTMCQVRGWRGFKSEWVINEKEKREINLLTQTYFEGEQDI